MVFCCESCYAMEEELPDEILDNVTCKFCDSGLTLREDECPGSAMQKALIKTWLLEGKTPEWIIHRFSKDYDPLKRVRTRQERVVINHERTQSLHPSFKN